ncbi:DUF3054 domain-containing protein [Kocuria massiliensis]|uniref:DUF3054 domain-containing protein n=1 Tax=Kocuria massiliensis TaxID=1926282 RepID=UPI001C47E492|nr:DUF3054 domain-containing protein [Kocuria massiliensis]
MTPSPTLHSERRAAPSMPVWAFAIIDALLIMIFAGIGRASHGEAISGIAMTAWPFLVGGAVGWIVSRAWRRPEIIFPTGVAIWVSTVVVGMILRAITGAGTHWSFIIVATIATGVFLLGFRLVIRLIQRFAHGPTAK